MKQVTIESVKKRISDSQLAEDTFGLGLNGAFELSCLRDLVAVSEQARLLRAQRAAVLAATVTSTSQLWYWAACESGLHSSAC